MSEGVSTASPAAPVVADVPVFGLSDCMARLDGNAELLERLVGIYLNALPGHMDRMKHALAGDDWASAGRVVHLLCGASANVGACRVTALAKQWDARLRGGDKGLYDVSLLEVAVADYIQAVQQHWPGVAMGPA